MFQKTTSFRIFFWVSFLCIGFFVFFPLLWMINTALKPTSETFSTYFFAGPLTLDNIIHILTSNHDIFEKQPDCLLQFQLLSYCSVFLCGI